MGDERLPDSGGRYEEAIPGRFDGKERASLHALLRKGVAPTRTLPTHAFCCAPTKAARIAPPELVEGVAGLDTHPRTVERTRRRFVEGGRPRPGGRPKLDDKQEAVLMALACSQPPEGYARWTMQLLADRLVALQVVDALSDETVRRTLKKTL